MDFTTAMQLAPEICRLAGVKEPLLDSRNYFNKYAEDLAYIAKSLPQAIRPKWLKEWALTWRKLYDDFEEIRRKDPMVVYRPANPTSLEFHRSAAFIRYYRAGNRTSKTQSGYAEHYFCLTGHHPFRPMARRQASSIIVCGQSFKDYAPRVFVKKMLTGEDEINPLAPMFPEGGKWFNHYDARKHLLTIACRECAEAGKPGNCPSHHQKPTLGLVSGEGSKDAVEAFSVRLAHGDEHLPEEFFDAMKMRVADQPDGCLIFTGTPLHGPDAWEAVRLTSVAERDAKFNLKDPEKPESSPPLVSLHWCSQWDGGIVSHDAIRANMQGMDEFEIKSRIDGVPAALARNAVFDREVLGEMMKKCSVPWRGKLESPVPLIEVTDRTEMVWTNEEEGDLRVWKPPQENKQYIVAVDTAAGLYRGKDGKRSDPSCATVLRVLWKDGKTCFEQVAQFHAWIPILEYADEVFKLAVHYNSAQVVVELTGGFGRALVERLKGELAYWNIFRDTSKGEYAEFYQDSRFGVDTTAFNKSSMVAILQQIIKSKRLLVRCKDTIGELVAFEQEKTDLGNVRFRGAGGTHDDRVMALVIGVSTALNNALFDVEYELREVDKKGSLKEYSQEWQEIKKELREQEDAWQWT